MTTICYNASYTLYSGFCTGIKGIKTGFSTLGAYSMPFSKTVIVLSGGSGIYASSLTMTYGPQYVAEWCILATIRAVNNVTIGRTLGMTVVAPAVVPQVMPYLSFAVGLTAAYLVMVVVNVIFKHLFGIYPPEHDAAELLAKQVELEQRLANYNRVSELTQSLEKVTGEEKV